MHSSGFSVVLYLFSYGIHWSRGRSLRINLVSFTHWFVHASIFLFLGIHFLVYIDFHFGWLTAGCCSMLQLLVLHFFFFFSVANILVALFQFRKCTVALVIEMLTFSLKLAFHPSGMLQWRREGGIFGGLFCPPCVDIFNQSDQFKRICLFFCFLSLVGLFLFTGDVCSIMCVDLIDIAVSGAGPLWFWWHELVLQICITRHLRFACNTTSSVLPFPPCVCLFVFFWLPLLLPLFLSWHYKWKKICMQRSKISPSNKLWNLTQECLLTFLNKIQTHKKLKRMLFIMTEHENFPGKRLFQTTKWHLHNS